MRCDNGSQYTSGEFRKAMPILGIKVDRIRVSTPQQSGHVESLHNALKHDYTHTHDFERLQDAEACCPWRTWTTTPTGPTPRSDGCRPTSSSSSGKGTINGWPDDDGGDRSHDPPKICLKIVLNRGGGADHDWAHRRLCQAGVKNRPIAHKETKYDQCGGATCETAAHRPCLRHAVHAAKATKSQPHRAAWRPWQDPAMRAFAHPLLHW